MQPADGPYGWNLRLAQLRRRADGVGEEDLHRRRSGALGRLWGPLRGEALVSPLDGLEPDLGRRVGALDHGDERVGEGRELGREGGVAQAAQGLESLTVRRDAELELGGAAPVVRGASGDTGGLGGLRDAEPLGDEAGHLVACLVGMVGPHGVRIAHGCCPGWAAWGAGERWAGWMPAGFPRNRSRILARWAAGSAAGAFCHPDGGGAGAKSDRVVTNAGAERVGAGSDASTSLAGSALGLLVWVPL